MIRGCRFNPCPRNFIIKNNKNFISFLLLVQIPGVYFWMAVLRLVLILFVVAGEQVDFVCNDFIGDSAILDSFY